MKTLATARESFGASFRSGRLWLIQSLANPVLFLLFVLWLLLPVEHGWQIVLNGLLILLVAAGTLVLHGGTLNYFHDRSRTSGAALRPAFLRAARHAVATLILVAILYGLWALLQQAGSYSDTLPAYVRSTLPAWVRRHVSFGQAQDSFAALMFVVCWIVIPGLLLPFALSTSDEGFRGFGRSGIGAWKKTVSKSSYWLVLAVAALLGVFATTRLMAWTPNFTTSTLHSESISLTWRLLLSYVLGLGAWMVTCSLVARCGAVSARVGDVSGHAGS